MSAATAQPEKSSGQLQTINDGQERENSLCQSSLLSRCYGGWFAKELKKLLKLSVPISLSFTFQISLLWISLVFLGHLPSQNESSTSKYAAAGLGSSFLTVSGIAVGHGLASASDTLSSQAYGFKNYKRVGVILQRGILILSLIVFPIWAVWLNTESLLLLIHQPPCVARFSDLYVKLYTIALPFIFLYVLLQHYLQSQSLVWQFVLIGFIVNCVSAFLHAVTIYGAKIGFLGAVVSLIISNILPPFMVISYVWFRKLHKETWGGWSFQALEEWLLYLKLAIPGMVMTVLTWWAFEVMHFLAGALGEVELAVNIVWYQLMCILFMPSFGFSVATSVRVGNELGAGNPQGAKRVTFVAVIITFVFSTFCNIILLSTKNVITYLFIQDNEQVVEQVSKLLYIGCLVVYFDQFQYTLVGALKGSGRQHIGAAVNFFTFYIVGIPLGTVLGFLTSLAIYGLWIGMLVALIGQCVFFLTILMRTDWQKLSDKAIRRAQETTCPASPDELELETLSSDQTKPSDYDDDDVTISKETCSQDLLITSEGNTKDFEQDFEDDDDTQILLTRAQAHRKDSHVNLEVKKYSYRLKKFLLHSSFYVIGFSILIAGGVSSRFHPHVDQEDYSNCTNFGNSTNESGLRGLPFIGNTAHLMKSLHSNKAGKDNLHYKLHMEYGPIYKLKMIGNSWNVHVASPEAFEALFRAEGKYPSRGFHEDNMVWLYKKLETPPPMFFSNNEIWKAIRSNASKQVVPRRVGNFVEPLSGTAKELLLHLETVQDEHGNVADIMPELSKWAFQGVSYFVYNEHVDIYSGADPVQREFLEAGLDYLQQIPTIVSSLPFYKLYPTRTYRNYERVLRRVQKAGRLILRRRFEKIKDLISSGHVDENHTLGLLDQWLIEGKFTEEEALSQSFDMLSAGIDTTSNTACFLVYEIAKNSELQDRLVQEITSIVGDKKHPSWDDLQKMTLVRNCVKEILRLYTPLPGIPRILAEDSVLLGYQVPAGVSSAAKINLSLHSSLDFDRKELLLKTNVLACFNVVTRDDEVFDDPNEFKPDRWSKDMSEKLHPFSSLPFGFGPRSCYGRRLAELELYVLLTEMLPKYRISTDVKELRVVQKLILRPGMPVHINFKPRI